MRVLHINANYITSALHQVMIEHLDELNIDSMVFAPTFDKKRCIIEPKDYVTVSECFKKWDRLVYRYKQKKIIAAVEKTYNISQFDIIHAYTLFTDGNTAMELSKKYDIPYVVAVRNTDLNMFFKKMIHLRSRGVEILKNASAVFFLSPVYRDVVIKNYVPEHLRNAILKKSYVIPNGIDDFWHENIFDRKGSAIAERIKSEKVLKCIYVGGIDENKNIELTLKALTQMNKEGWRCTLTSVGKIVDRSTYEQLCTYAFFRYVEPKKKEQLLDYYRDADLFIMPSHTETFGLVYAEAMSQGLPVIYTKGQGFDGQFEDGVVGYSVDDKNSDELVDIISNVVRQYPRFVNMCLSSVDRFKWEIIVKKYSNVYGEIHEKDHNKE